jgi:hypothetical protein
MRLNLGCGDDIQENYVNVDFRKTHPSVVVADLSKFPWNMSPASVSGIFSDSSADEIMMLDVLEHFPYAMTRTILMECRRILKQDGVLIIQVPDGLQTARALIQEGEYLCNRCGRGMLVDVNGENVNLSTCLGCKATADDISEAAMRRLYGGQNYQGNFHQTCFTEKSLAMVLVDTGFHYPSWVEQEYMWKNWTIKAQTKPGDIW